MIVATDSKGGLNYQTSLGIFLFYVKKLLGNTFHHDLLHTLQDLEFATLSRCI